MLDGLEAVEATDMPGNVINGNSNFLKNKCALISMNLMVNKNFKLFESSQYHMFSKRVHLLLKIITGQWVYFQSFLKYLVNKKRKFLYSLTIFYQSVSAIFEMGMARKAVYDALVF